MKTNVEDSANVPYFIRKGIMIMLTIELLYSGGVRTTIAKHHGRYSKSDHLCQDGVE